MMLHNEVNYSYILSLVFISVFVYVLISFNAFYLLFVFDLKSLKTLNDLKIFKSSFFTTISFMIVITSFSGMPPLLGFMPKFLLFTFLIKLSNFFLVLYFSFLNFLMAYFYIQNLRFLTSSSDSVYFCVSNHSVQLSLLSVYSVIFLNFLNFFGFFYINEFSVYSLLHCSHIQFN